MRPALLPLLLLPLTACGGDDTAVPAAQSARPSTSVTDSVSAAPTPTRTAEPTPASAPSPTPSPSPSATRVVPAAQGDVDGDGEPDEISYEGREAVVVLSGGGTLRASTEADIDGDEPLTAGVEDLDRDGRAEVFVEVGRGASTAFLLVLRYDGGQLAALRSDGRPRLLGYGGSATHGDGFTCADDGSLVVRSATSDDGEAYALETVTYRVRDGVLVETARDSGTAQGASDPAVAASYLVDCRSVGEGA